MYRQQYVETPLERRRRVGLESAIKRRARARYRIQINLKYGYDTRTGVHQACSYPLLFPSKAEAWAFMDKVNPMKFFPNARSASVECVYSWETP